MRDDSCGVVCWVESGTGEKAAGVVMCVGRDAECGRRESCYMPQECS